MTVPTFDPEQIATPTPAFDPDAYARRLKLIMGDATFQKRPGMAKMLADGDVSESDLQVISGATRMLDLRRTVELARTSKQVVDLSPSDKALLSSANVQYQDVDFASAVKAQEMVTQSAQVAVDSETSFWSLDDDDNWFESIVGAVSDAVGWTLGKIGEAGQAIWAGVTTPYRMNASAPVQFGELSVNPSAGQLRTQAEQTGDMKSKGYDPANMLDQIQYYYHGEQVYADTSDLREQYGDDKIEYAKKFLADPEAAQKALGDLEPDAAAAIIESFQGEEGQDILDKVDARHFSPGRDVARTLFEEGSGWFKFTSGTLDAAASWFADPLIVVGKGAVALRARKFALDDAMDMAGAGRLMAENKQIQTGWQGLLDAGKAFRGAADDATKAKIYAGARVRYGPLMGLWDEINGRRVIVGDHAGPSMMPNLTPRADTERVVTFATDSQKIVDTNGLTWMTGTSQPIETLEDMTSYLVNTNGLLRLGNGFAAQKQVLMPGKVSWWTERKARVAEARTEKGLANAPWLDYTDPSKILPHADEAVDVDAMEAAAAARGMGFHDYVKSNLWRRVTGRAERASRRISTLLPEVSRVDLRSANAAETVRRVAALYLPKYEADRLTALFTAKDLAGKRQIYKGMVQQVFHAAGLPLSKSGREYMKRMSDDLDSPVRYGFGENGDVLRTSEGDARRVALYPEQLDNYVVVPDFTEMQRIAAKLSVWDRYSGSRLSDQGALKKGAYYMGQFGVTRHLFAERTDKLMSMTKIGMISKPASGLRNALDELAGVFLRGEGGSVLRAQRVANAARRVALQDDVAKRFTRLSGAAARGGKPVTTLVDAMEKVNGSRVARLLKQIPGVENMQKVGVTTEEMAEYAAELPWDRLDEVFEGLISDGRYYNDTWMAKGSKETMEALKAGYVTQKFTTKWNEIPLENQKGLEAWSHNLAHRFADDGLGVAALNGIASGDLRAAVDNVLVRLKTPELEDFRQRAEILTHTADGTKVSTAVLEEKALLDHARRIVEDIKFAITGRNGKISNQLVGALKTGELSPDVLSEIPKAFRPEHAIAREAVPIAVKPVTAVGRTADAAIDSKLATAYTGAFSKAYDMFVTKQVNWLVRHPLFTVFYSKARKNMKGYEQKLQAEGLSAPRAEEIAQKVAQRHAAHQVALRVDNPTVRSQFSVIARNWWMFERAQEDFLRRWSRLIKEDPTRLRKAQLALEGGIDSGMIDRDENGSLIFSYPGSGAVITAMAEVANFLKFTNFAQVPQYSDLTSKLIFLNASLDNPVGFSATPIIVTPLKWLKMLYPESGMMVSDIEYFAAGELGAGREWYETFLPPVAVQFFKPMSSDEKDSQMASSVVNALKHLAAGGQLPPADASPEEIDEFLSNVRTTTRNQLFTRFALGLFLPAAPGMSEADDTVAGSDTLFQALGIEQLDQEFKKMINDWGYEQALAVWTKLHPDKLVYTVSRSKTTTGTFLPPTREVGEFIDANGAWVKKYSSIAPYFMPQNQGEFSQTAWNAELELGVREYKSIPEFYNEVRIKNAEMVYYDAKDAYDAKILEAQIAGDKDLKKQFEAEWSSVKDDILKANPLLAAKFADYAARDADREQKRTRLQQMLSDPLTPKTEATASVGKLLEAYEAYSKWIADHKGLRDKETTVARQSVKAEFKAFADALVEQHPSLSDVYNGLFRID